MSTQSLFRKTLFFIAAFAFVSTANAQDPEFSQFYAAPLYTNPAFAGTAQGGRMVLNYRNQWPGLPGTFRTFAASYDEHFGGLNGGIGLMAVSDRAGQGLLTTNSFSGIYSYQLDAGRNLTFKAGIQATIVQKSIDFDKLLFGDQIVPREGFKLLTNEPRPDENKSFANFSTGFIGFTKTFYGGVAIHNLTEPNQSFYNNPDFASLLPRRFTAHAGMVIPLSNSRYNESSISPNILYMQQREFTQLNLGFYINKGPLVAGLWFRQTSQNSDAAMVLLGFRKDKFKFGYSYDVTVSSARSAATGSHEISTSIEWKKRTPRKRYKQLNCPQF